MIKTYDEALKTLNDVRKYLTINRADDCVQELDKVARYFINEKYKENPNLEQCIKEWESRGMEVKILNNENVINIFNPKVYSVISINLENKLYIKTDSVIYSCGESITFDEHNLISKTLKALEVLKDE